MEALNAELLYDVYKLGTSNVKTKEFIRWTLRNRNFNQSRLFKIDPFDLKVQDSFGNHN